MRGFLVSLGVPGFPGVPWCPLGSLGFLIGGGGGEGVCRFAGLPRICLAVARSRKACSLVESGGVWGAPGDHWWTRCPPMEWTNSWGRVGVGSGASFPTSAHHQPTQPGRQPPPKETHPAGAHQPAAQRHPQASAPTKDHHRKESQVPQRTPRDTRPTPPHEGPPCPCGATTSQQDGRPPHRGSQASPMKPHHPQLSLLSRSPPSLAPNPRPSSLVAGLCGCCHLVGWLQRCVVVGCWRWWS